jgi:ribosomal protein L11 methyltransferase
LGALRDVRGALGHQIANMCPDNLKEFIYSIFENHYIRLTPSDLERMVYRSHPDFSRKAVRSTIKAMVADGGLIYSNHFNTTHLELNYCRPVRFSPRIMLMPDGHGCTSSDAATQVIRMLQGVAFGIGDHPTTRLAIRAVDDIMSDMAARGLTRGIRALDIGTGSGVLAIAAAKLGAANVVALDIDPLALHEARNNILLNDLGRAIVVSDEPLENLADTSFDLIMANLRPPTLKQILPQVESLSSMNCHWIFSGFRQDAMEDAIRMLPEDKCEILVREAACGWGAVTIRYRGSEHHAR